MEYLDAAVLLSHANQSQSENANVHTLKNLDFQTPNLLYLHRHTGHLKIAQAKK